jgi:hypothetical protein
MLDTNFTKIECRIEFAIIQCHYLPLLVPRCHHFQLLPLAVLDFSLQQLEAVAVEAAAAKEAAAGVTKEARAAMAVAAAALGAGGGISGGGGGGGLQGSFCFCTDLPIPFDRAIVPTTLVQPNQQNRNRSEKRRLGLHQPELGFSTFESFLETVLAILKLRFQVCSTYTFRQVGSEHTGLILFAWMI